MVIQLLLAQATLERLSNIQAMASEIHQPLEVSELKQYATTVAKNEGIDDVWRFLYVAGCESGWVTNIRSRAIHNGVQENSWGIYQINLDAHLDVTWEQATDPYFNIKWAATHWYDAAHHWKNCYQSAK